MLEPQGIFLMELSTELAQPGPEGSPLATTYSLLNGNYPQSNNDDMFMQELFVMRFFLEGEWLHRTSPDRWDSAPVAALWGTASTMMKLKCPTPFRTFSISMRTAAWLELSGLPPEDFVDRVSPIEPFVGSVVPEFLRDLRSADNIAAMAILADTWLGGLRRAKMRPQTIDRARIFEGYSNYQWDRPIGEIAEEFGLSIRQLERMTTQSIGFKPKLLTRRHRFFNIATALRGIGDVEWQDLCYRYYADQSHMNREFRKFAGMTPGEFKAAHAPLLDATLRFRNASYHFLATPEGRNRLSSDLPAFRQTI